MALGKFKTGWRRVELIESASGARLVCDTMAERVLTRGMRRTPTALVGLVSALKILVLAGILSSLFDSAASGMGWASLGCRLLLALLVAGYTIFGFYPLVFGEFVLADGVKVMPLSSEDAALLDQQVTRFKEGDHSEKSNAHEG